MPTKDTALINSFLSEFVSRLSKEFPEDLDFILLFGSAARGEFLAGVSDVDLVIAVKDGRAVRRVERFAEKIFWELDKKHKTGFRKVCSTGREDVFSIFEKKVRLYKPFEVLASGDLNWKEGEISAPGLGAFTIIAPVQQFARKLKKEGRILYGRDILAEIIVRDSLIDKMKSILLPYLLSLLAVPVSFVFPEKGLRYSIKAVLYSIDSQLFLLAAEPAKKASLNMRILRSELGQFYSIRLAKEALHAKKNFGKILEEWSYPDKVFFCLQAPPYILYNNLMSLLGRRL